jgi:hypothetical protein
MLRLSTLAFCHESRSPRDIEKTRGTAASQIGDVGQDDRLPDLGDIDESQTLAAFVLGVQVIAALVMGSYKTCHRTPSRW